MRGKRKCALATVFLLAAGCRQQQPIKDGDIIFQTSQSSQSLAIQRATDSIYSHVGMIFFRSGKPYVFEAVDPVKYTPLDNWIARGKNGNYVIKRLKDEDRLLTSEVLKNMKFVAGRFEGKPYDDYFGWSDERIYCSELVWKIYQQVLGIKLGKLQKLRELNLADPIVAEKLKERYGKNIPLDEKVISPASMFESTQLVTIRQG